MICRLVGHYPTASCVGTWGNDDRWQCLRCGKDLGPMAIGPWRPVQQFWPYSAPTWGEIIGETHAR